jgi:uncharacterized protein YkwD
MRAEQPGPATFRRGREQSSPHRSNLLLPNVRAAGVGLAQKGSGRPYWTLVLGAE